VKYCLYTVTSYVFYGIHIRALIVKIQEYTNKCNILLYTALTTTSLELQHV